MFSGYRVILGLVGDDPLVGLASTPRAGTNKLHTPEVHVSSLSGVHTTRPASNGPTDAALSGPPASSVVCSPTPFRCLPICECSDSFSLGSFRRYYHPARVYGLRLYGMFNRCPNPVDNHFFPFGITYHPRSQVPKRNVWYHVWQRLYPFPHLMGEIEEDFSTPNVNLCGLIPLPRKIFPHSSKCARPPKKIYSGPPANRLFQIHPVRRSE